MGQLAETLGGALAALAVHTRVLVAPAASGSAAAPLAGQLPRRSAAALVSALEALGQQTLVLHYSGYGYQSRGYPRWLGAGVEAWLRGDRSRRLIVVFHELYATGRPWQSSFWLSPLQRRLAGRLCGRSITSITSVDQYAARLRSWCPEVPVITLPVFSTVGEPAAPVPLGERRRQLVLFGSPGLRGRAYRDARSALVTACETLELDRVLDIGIDTASPSAIAGVPVVRLGFRGASEVSSLLAESLAGFLCYPPQLLGKSTVFAAYCAHGMLPICDGPGAGPAGAHPPCWRPAPAAGPADLAALAAAAHDWYAEHSLSRHAAVYGALLS